ncbi:MAG: AAA family ATPase [Clostridia bacterium]
MEKIKSFQITRLRMVGFKSYAEPVEYVFGNPTVITGGNGSGKSSIADAIAFAITGLPFFGERRIDRMHSDSTPELYVSICFQDENQCSHELTRTRKNSRMAITFDGYEIRQSDLTDLFGERDVFLSIFNPLYFIEELGDDGKNLLQRYLPLIPQEQIVSQLSEASQAALQGDQLLSPEVLIKKLRDRVRELDDSVLYLQGQQDLADQQGRAAEDAVQKLTERLAALQEEECSLKEKQFSGMSVSTIQEELVDLSARYSDLASDHSTESKVQALDSCVLELNQRLGERRASIYTPKYGTPIAETAARIQNFAQQYKEEISLFNSITPGMCCPACRREVSEADLPAVKCSFQVSVGKIVSAGKNQHLQLEQLQELERKAEETFQKFKNEDISKLESEITEANQKRNAACNTANQDQDLGATELARIRAEIQTLTSDLQYGTLSQEEYQRLLSCGDEIRQTEADLIANQKMDRTSAEEYKTHIDAANEEITACKDKIGHLVFYLSKRAELTFSQLKINRVEFSLYDVVKTTGEFKDAFKFTYAGRRYDWLSLSEKIRAGMEVSELIKRLTGRNYPVFVDNMESVDDLNNVRPTGQLLMAKCVCNAELCVRSIHPIVEQTQKAA